jgi:hypothetical protein
MWIRKISARVWSKACRFEQREFFEVKGEYWSFEINEVIKKVHYIISIPVLKEMGLK